MLSRDRAPCRRGAARLVELGCSAGLNLLWDRYGYALRARPRPGRPVLSGEERATVPAELLALAPRVRSRVGVDLEPPDLRTEHGVRLLKAFVWAGQEERLRLLDRAVEVWRAGPPEVVRGDMLDELPALLARRRDDGLLVVWQTAALNYLPRERRARVRATIAAAAADGPLAFVETARPNDGSHTHYGLFVQIWPGGSRIELAHADFHGAWLAWCAA